MSTSGDPQLDIDEQWCRSRQAFVAQRGVDGSAARTSAAEAGAAGWVLYWSSLVTAEGSQKTGVPGRERQLR
jgi:hypothetical protein